MSVTAGVVAVQGDVSEHATAVRRAAKTHDSDLSVVTIRQAGAVPECDWLLLPGGESTTISRLLHREGIAEEIRAHVAAGKPLLATCAGLIVAGADANDDRVEELGLIDVSIRRNAFGRQKDSFETALAVEGLDRRFPAVFIRAPVIDRVGGVLAPDASRRGPPHDATVLASFDGNPVAIRDGPVVGTSFHPELTDDSRIHRLAFFEQPPLPE